MFDLNAQAFNVLITNKAGTAELYTAENLSLGDALDLVRDLWNPDPGVNVLAENGILERYGHIMCARITPVGA